MLEQLLTLVKEQAQELIVKNTAVPNEHNEAVMGDVARVIQEKLGQAIGSGKIADVMDLFKNGAAVQNPVVQQIIAGLEPQLAKYGISKESAASIATTLIPRIMEQFVNKTNDSTNSQFNLNDILKSAGGKDGIDLGGIAGNLLNGDLGKSDVGKLIGGFFGK